VLHETGRTMKYGAEFLYRAIWRARAPVSAFIGGGKGVRMLRHRATCSFGACNDPGPYAAVLRDERLIHSYVSAITGMDILRANVDSGAALGRRRLGYWRRSSVAR
jgi:hypothetical protein